MSWLHANIKHAPSAATGEAHVSNVYACNMSGCTATNSSSRERGIGHCHSTGIAWCLNSLPTRAASCRDFAQLTWDHHRSVHFHTCTHTFTCITHAPTRMHTLAHACSRTHASTIRPSTHAHDTRTHVHVWWELTPLPPCLGWKVHSGGALSQPMSCHLPGSWSLNSLSFSTDVHISVPPSAPHVQRLLVRRRPTTLI